MNRRMDVRKEIERLDPGGIVSALSFCPLIWSFPGI